jgi:hypothetical protein
MGQHKWAVVQLLTISRGADALLEPGDLAAYPVSLGHEIEGE